MEKRKVLIIDDSRGNIVFLANNILRPKGYDIITAMDGEKGLHKALEEKPDLIIMDSKVPEMSGLEVLTALRQKQCRIPVILTTHDSSVSMVVEAFRRGAKDYIIKPYTVEDMERALKRVLSNGWPEQKFQSPEPAEGQRPEPRPERDEGPVEGLREGISEINQQLERRVRELSTLHDIGQAVTSLLDLEKVLNRVVEAAVGLTGAEEGFLLLVDRETEELYMRAAQGLSQKEARSFRIRVEDSLSGQVITTGKPLMFSSVKDQKAFAIKTGYLVKALLHVPLRLRNEVIGVLSASNKISPKPFTNNDLRMLTILAGYAAVAIENALLYQSVEEKAQLSQLPHTQEGQVKDGTDSIIRELEIYEQQLKASREEAEQVAGKLRTVVAALDDLSKRLKVHQKETEELEDTVPKPSSQPTILIVEDEPDLLEVLRIKMSREGYRALAVPDGPQTLDVLASEEVDLVILDAAIPPPDGYEICQILKADHRHRHTPIIMLSARGMSSDVAKGYAAGADYYITKPIKLTALVRKVRDILGE